MAKQNLGKFSRSSKDVLQEFGRNFVTSHVWNTHLLKPLQRISIRTNSNFAETIQLARKCFICFEGRKNKFEKQTKCCCTVIGIFAI